MEQQELRLKIFQFNEVGENTYLLYAPGGDAVIIDCGAHAEAEWIALTTTIEQEKCTPIMLLNTHGHFDHLFGVKRAKEHWNIPFAMHPSDEPLLKMQSAWGWHVDEGITIDRPLKDGDEIELAGHTIQVIATPGHSPGGVCFYIESIGILFSGDTLFNRSVGRTDLYQGDHAQLIEGIRARLLKLPDDTIVLPGHGPRTTIGEEKEMNPFLR